MTHRAPPLAPPVQPAFAQPTAGERHVASDAGAYKLVRLDTGAVRIDVAAGIDRMPQIEVAPFVELPEVPVGWTATLAVTATDESEIAAFGESATRHVFANETSTFEVSACEATIPLILHIEGGPLSVTVVPTLRLASCLPIFE